ncbi:CGNR zinc finger domain-containing protein [Streptomyces sp. NPDC032198]|uniref:CGNR zinc finger domain-containing protein n=1 Tax=Streptomyces sp. NPDC032198 TaxID=3155127 RepID=UPI0033F15295
MHQRDQDRHLNRRANTPDRACRDVDTSRNSAKQFCSPACQSRVKAVAHRARRAASAEAAEASWCLRYGDAR